MPFAWKSFAQAQLAMLLTLGLFGSVSACATGSGEETAEPPPVGGGSGGADPGDATDGQTGGKDGSTGGTSGSGGTSTGGTGGDGGTGGTSPGLQCDGCGTDDDCQADFHCVTSPAGDKFCAQDCSSDTCADSTTECVDLATYGASDADAGIATGKGCVPAQDGTCPCTAGREGASRACSKKNTHGTCLGTETCTSGQWVGCDAATATAEVCDNKDNNCNGAIDMAEPGTDGNQLCAGGSSPPHSGFACVQGSCELNGCEPGWSKYPPNLPITAGCACPVDASDTAPASNDTCAQASDAAEIPDVGGSPLTLQGTLSSDGDQDWYTFIAKDVLQVPTPNSFRLHIEFLAPDGNLGDEYRFDVLRVTAADPCPAAGAKTSLTTYDWCADVTTTPATPADGDQTSMYRLRVYRNPGATGTCNTYKIRISNGGSGACPAGDACGET